MNTTQQTITPTTVMTAWSQSRYGGPEILEQQTLAVPAPGPGEVLVRVRATAVNSADLRILRGDPYLVRLAFGLRKPKIAVQGRDVAGIVEAVGEGVTSHRVGDRVVGEVEGGGFAEFIVAPHDRLVPIPAGLDHGTAAALPLAGGTAWQALDAAKIPAPTKTGNPGPSAAPEPGSDLPAHLNPRVLVLGAGGGVGLYVSRLAVLRGATVHALASSSALEALAGQGVGWAQDRRGVGGNEPIEQVLSGLEAESYDAIIELGGNTPLRSLRRLLKASGVIVGIAGGENRVFGPMSRIIRGAIVSMSGKRRFIPLLATAKAEVTTQLLALAAAGKIMPVITGELPLTETPAALASFERGGVVGKLVVVAAPQPTR